MNHRFAVAAHLDASTSHQHAVNPATAVDLIWAQSTPEDHLDHVRVQNAAGTDEMELVLILRATDAAAAAAQAQALCARSARSPLLRHGAIDVRDVVSLADLLL